VTYRVKLLLVFIAVALITNGISLGVMYWLSSHYLYDGFRESMLSVTATAAAMVDGDDLKKIQSRVDEGTPAYARIQETLKRVWAANSKWGTRMKVFTVVKTAENPNALTVAVDPNPGSETKAHAGEIYRPGSKKVPDIRQPTVEENFITDEFGKPVLRASAPVLDASGGIAGAVIVEAPETWVELKMRPILSSVIFSLLLAIGFAVPVALVISRKTSAPLVDLQSAVKRIGAGDFDTPLAVRSKDEFGQVAEAVNAMAKGLKERDRVKSTFARYVSHQVMDSILKSDRAIQLSGDRRRITVLFCDIRGFSTISERLPPEKVVKLLNDYFECMVEVVFRNNGTLDKFIGDGMMVIFGAPEDDPFQEDHALKTAIEMQQELKLLAARWKPEGLDIRSGIGINSGPAVVGNIGSSRRMDYTAIGDTVNLASRLETATKDLSVAILVSEYTYMATRGSFRFKEMGSIRVKGRSDPVMTYTPEVVDTEVTAGA
jgi:adenylate cyclase